MFEALIFAAGLACLCLLYVVAWLPAMVLAAWERWTGKQFDETD